MRNDLDKLNLGDGVYDGATGKDGPKITRKAKIRDSTYYIVARVIRFGIDPADLLDDCNLIQNIITDLSM